MDDGGDDAELQLLIQQQRVALRHLEALTARRTQQRSDAALSPVPQRAGAEWGHLGGRASTPVPESIVEPLPQRAFSSRATTPVPSSPDMQVLYTHCLLCSECPGTVSAGIPAELALQ